jgi:hypothetical protein
MQENKLEDQLRVLLDRHLNSLDSSQEVKHIKVTTEFFNKLLLECNNTPPPHGIAIEYSGFPIVIDNEIEAPFEVIYKEKYWRCKICNCFELCVKAFKNGGSVRCPNFGDIMRYVEGMIVNGQMGKSKASSAE